MSKLKRVSIEAKNVPGPNKSYLKQARSLDNMDAFGMVALSLHHYQDGQYYLQADNGYVLEEWQWDEVRWGINNFYEEVDEKVVDNSNQRVRESHIKKRQSRKREKQTTDRDEEDIGYVYLMEGDGYYKIGKSIAPVKRNEQLSVKLPFEVELIHKVESDQYSKLEKFLHNKFSDKRTNGEWFDLNKEDVEYIRGLDGDEYEAL